MKKITLTLLLLTLSACANTNGYSDSASETSSDSKPGFSSTYIAPQAPSTLIKNANIYTGLGDQLEQTDIIVKDGKIIAVGKGLTAPDEANIVNANGRWLTPGLIDVHSHMGVYSSPSIASLADGNEITGPNTSEVWAEHGVWSQDPNFEKALAGGITTVQILPGSANLFGGRGVVLKNVPSVTMTGMKFPDAPHSLKMACGENPKRVYAEKGGPYSRMGNMAGYRKAWIDAKAYKQKWDAYKNGKSSEAPKQDLALDTLMGVLNGEISVHNHCYRADEMANMIELAKEFGYKITAFHHAVEAYKIAPILADNDICAVVWADWWGFKQEAFDMVRENAALVELAGGCAIIHSDDEIQIQRLNQEVAKVWSAANRMGMELTKAEAIKWLTHNAARSINLEDKIGSIGEGMNADLVLWSADPFSVYAKADTVWIDGAVRFDRTWGKAERTSDFNLGIITPEGDRP